MSPHPKSERPDFQASPDSIGEHCAKEYGWVFSSGAGKKGYMPGDPDPVQHAPTPNDSPSADGNGNGLSVRDTALLALDLGLSPGRPKQDGSKRPDGDWKKYQTTPATPVIVARWYDDGATGVGLFTGYGNLELFEFDCRQTYDRFKEAAVALNLGELVERIEAGYLENTPGGGVHWLWRCEAVTGNTKLAERSIATDEDPNAREPLIETRGVGGWVVIAPSNGSVHPSGGQYELIRGGLKTIVTVTPDEREALFSLARSFDEIPVKPTDAPKPKGRPKKSATQDGITPVDDFNARADHRDVLEGFGWTLAHTAGSVEYWLRPGKDRGWSATWGKTKGFRVFTTSTPLEANSHTLAHVYCVLKHQGDWTSCVKDLVQQGYGTWIDAEGKEHPNPPPPAVKIKFGGKKAQDGEAADPEADYILTKEDRPVRCVSNTITWLSRNRPGWVKYDSFRREILLGGKPMADQAVVDLVNEIEVSFGMGWTRSHVEDALVGLAHRNEFSSLAQYLRSVKWDGTNRLESFFTDHFETEDIRYHREVARVMFLSAVARALDPGCKVDTVPLLIGGQGLMKSFSIRALCPHDEWFTDNIGDLHGGAETAKRLAGKWLIELGELAAMKRSEIEYVKQFVTIQADNYRPSYGRGNQDFPRACIFIGTTNDEEPLQDCENRRFLPVHIVRGNPDAIRSVRDQLWAEAVHRFKQGEKWWTTNPSILIDASRYAEMARAKDAWEGILRAELEFQNQTTMVEAATLLGITKDRLSRSEQTRIGNALRKIGFKHDRESTGDRERFYTR